MQVDHRKMGQTSIIWIVLLADLDFTFVHVWVRPLQSESLLLKLCGVKPPLIAGKNLRKLVDEILLK